MTAKFNLHYTEDRENTIWGIKMLLKLI